MDSKMFVLDNMRNIGLQSAEKLQRIAPDLDGTAIIDNEEYVPDFNPNKHQYLDWLTGEVVRDNGQVWQLIQPYDSKTYKDRPENMRAQWGLCHTKNPKRAKPFVRPLGTSGMYMKDECYLDDDGVTVYIAKENNTVMTYDEYPDGWKVYTETEE